jgi:outer membrane protein OmpA-like peptidoglycan-associated protein
MTGWGAMIPGGTAAHGVLKVTYGSGTPAGLVPRVLVASEPRLAPEPRLVHVQVKPNESALLSIPDDVLFDFDSARLNAKADEALKEAANIINNRDEKHVSIVGHTDSVGKASYNLDLSLRRANSVKTWMLQHRLSGAHDFQVKGMRETHPVAPNKKPDGSDDPQGRKRNRRVEIHFSH